MGVYINMEMPKAEFGSMIVAIRPDGMVEDVMGCYVGKAVSVPEPHGRLGDLDDIIKRAKKWIDHPDEYISQRNKDMIYILEREDAIIPASLDGEPNKEC